MKNEIRAHWIVQVMPGNGKVARQERNNNKLRVKYPTKWPDLRMTEVPNLKVGGIHSEQEV